MCDLCARTNPFQDDWLHFEGAEEEIVKQASISIGDALGTPLFPADAIWSELGIADHPDVAGLDIDLSILQAIWDSAQTGVSSESGATLSQLITAYLENTGVLPKVTLSDAGFLDEAAASSGVNASGQLVTEAPVQAGSDLPFYDNDQIADQLINGYWESTGRSARSWDIDVSSGQTGIVYVDYSSLEAPGKWFAELSLEIWSDVTGITFSTDDVPLSDPDGIVDITFDDDFAIAQASTTVWDDGEIYKVTVYVGENWISGDHYSVDSYALQTYLHELGHALGLGHAGNYNADTGAPITYAADAEFKNDNWQATVMSYFSQSENTEVDATRAYLLTPTIADIIALQEIYGVSGTLRTGDTTYGVGSTAGDSYDNLETNYNNMAFTILDDGGTDTIDFSDTAENQNVDLNDETYSDVGGEVGNMGIARGTIIENFRSGTGDDTILGNEAANELYGGGGIDILTGGLGDDSLFGGSGDDTASYQMAASGITASITSGTASGGAGNDVFDSIENLIGSSFADTFEGDENANLLKGGQGDDTLEGKSGEDILYGNSGDDDLSGNGGRDFMYGGNGDDTLKGGNLKDKLIGGNGNDILFGQSGYDTLNGNAGNDFLNGGGGNDRLWGRDGSDTFIFATDFGSDTIRDWESGIDRLDFSAWGFDDVSEINALADNLDGDLVLTFGDGSQLTVTEFADGSFAESEVIL